MDVPHTYLADFLPNFWVSRVSELGPLGVGPLEGLRHPVIKVGNNESVDSDFLTRLGVSQLKLTILRLEST